MTKYRTIVADPPWDIKGGPLKGGVGEGFVFNGTPQTRDLPYSPMTVDEICALRVEEHAAADCSLFLWTINGYVDAAFDVVKAWGFNYSELLVWAKNPMGGGLGGTFGISTEFFIHARRGKPKENRVTGTWFNWKRPYVNGKPSHSRKPKEFYELVRFVAQAPRLEMFARTSRAGWDAWGNEIPNDVEVKAS